jgi:hypothetical protein
MITVHAPVIRPARCLGLGSCYLGFTYSISTTKAGEVVGPRTHWYCKACAEKWDVEEEIADA